MELRSIPSEVVWGLLGLYFLGLYFRRVAAEVTGEGDFPGFIPLAIH